MKKTTILLFAFGMLQLPAFSQTPSLPVNDLSKNNVRGKVKEMKERTYNVKESGNEYTAGDFQSGYTYRYDDHGNQTQKIFISQDGAESDANYRHAYRYNAQGEKTEDIFYDNKAIIRKCIYQEGKCTVHPNENAVNVQRLYDDKGNLTDETFYGKDNKEVESRMTYAYDGKNRVIRQQYFLPGNQPGEITTIKYDDEKKSEEMTTTDATGNFVIKQIIYRDAHGNQIRSVVYSSPTDLLYDRSWTFEYDNEGNWTKQTSSMKIIIREFIYYEK